MGLKSLFLCGTSYGQFGSINVIYGVHKTANDKAPM